MHRLSISYDCSTQIGKKGSARGRRLAEQTLSAVRANIGILPMFSLRAVGSQLTNLYGTIVSLVLIFSALPVLSKTPPPNFILIMTDDQGYADVGVFGSKDIKTPHLDQLAKEGRMLTSYYSGNPVCSASRASLMTGCYSRRVLSEKTVLFPGDKIGLHPEEVTIAEVLKTKSYATACVGKWHLGHRPPFLPTQQGFDSYYGIPYSNDMSHPGNQGRPKYGQWDEHWKKGNTGADWGAPLMQGKEVIEHPSIPARVSPKKENSSGNLARNSAPIRHSM